MFSTPPRSQIPKTSTPDTPKPTHRHPTTSTPESSDNYTSDDSPKISKREIRPPPIKSIPKLAISSDEDKEKGPGVKGEGYDNVSSLLCKIGGKKKTCHEEDWSTYLFVPIFLGFITSHYILTATTKPLGDG